MVPVDFHCKKNKKKEKLRCHQLFMKLRATLSENRVEFMFLNFLLQMLFMYLILLRKTTTDHFDVH